MKNGLHEISELEAYILTLLNGTRTVEEICHNVKRSINKKVPWKKLKKDIKEYILALRKMNIVTFLPQKLDKKLCDNWQDEKEILERPKLFSLSIALTNKCGCDCVYCFAGNIRKRSVEILNRETLEKNLKVAMQIGLEEVVLTGGDLYYILNY